MDASLRSATVTDPLSRLAGLEGVASAMAATRDGIDALLRDRGLRRTSPEQTAESLLRGAHASAVLEGSEDDLDSVRAGGGGPETQAAVRVSTELLSLVPTLKTAPLQAFARLHTLAGKGVVDDADLGRPRDAFPRPRGHVLTSRILAEGHELAVHAQDVPPTTPVEGDPGNGCDTDRCARRFLTTRAG